MAIEISSEDLTQVLVSLNPWWEQRRVSLPRWRRQMFSTLERWVLDPPSRRALMVSGPRQVGKTTLMLHAIASALEHGIPPRNLLYATFDHPLIRAAGMDGVLRAWRNRMVVEDKEQCYLFLDELQHVPHWQTWVKHQIDFAPHLRIYASGSAVPMLTRGQESGVGRWHTLHVPGLSFNEYLQLRNVDVGIEPAIPLESLEAIKSWDNVTLGIQRAASARLQPHFHDYLMRGGFPGCVVLDDISEAQRYIREDIVNRVLRGDMTEFYGVRNLRDLEQLFLYLCMHDGSQLDLTMLSSQLQYSRPSVQNFLTYLESTHLVHLLLPHGYGKELLRGRPKAYLADPCISQGVLLKGESLLTKSPDLGAAVESAVFNHVFNRFRAEVMRISYWQGRGGSEVDFVVEWPEAPYLIEVKYQSKVALEKLRGLKEFCERREVKTAAVVVRESSELAALDTSFGTTVYRVPAPLFCYWISRSAFLRL